MSYTKANQVEAIQTITMNNCSCSFFTGREWSELGSRDIDCIGRMVMRPSERERTSQWLPDLGLYDYRNRAYSPEFGRFLQTDPKSFDADPSNLYRYCGNDPVDRTH